MKKIRIKINGGKGDSEECKKVQRVLFNMGYYWNTGILYQHFQNLDAGYLFAEESGRLGWVTADRMGDNYWSLNLGGYYDFELSTKTVVEHSLVPARATVTVLGKTYYEDEYEAALKTLNPIR